MSGGNSLYESQDLLGAVGEAKASTQNQDAEARRPEAGDGDVNRRRYGRLLTGAHGTPHTSLRSAYGATNNRRPPDARGEARRWAEARRPEQAGRERQARLKPLHRTKTLRRGRAGGQRADGEGRQAGDMDIIGGLKVLGY